MRWYLWAWKLCLTINLIQHNAGVIRQLFSLKNTYDVLKLTTHYLVLNMHSDVMKRIILKQLHFAFPQHLWGWYYFLYFTERRLALCGRDRKRESWDSSLERETAGLPTVLESFCHHKWLPGGIIRHKLIFMLLFLHPFWNGKQLQFAQPLI